MGDHRKLEVWHAACDLSDRLDRFVEALPRRVRSTLGDQIVRSADSIHMNISEGCGLNTDRQLARCLRVALGEANELESGLEALQRRRLLPPPNDSLLEDATVLRKRLGAFLKTVDGGE